MATFRWPSGWDPFAGLRAMQRELDRLSGRSFFGESRSIGGGVYPPVNVLNGPEEIVVECEVAGVQRGDIDLSITGETLVIRGTKHRPVEDDDVRYHRCERGTGDFNRTIVLPDKVDAEKISAALTEGILTVRLPKSEAALPRRIEVR